MREALTCKTMLAHSVNLTDWIIFHPLARLSTADERMRTGDNLIKETPTVLDYSSGVYFPSALASSVAPDRELSKTRRWVDSTLED